jgi:Baseplate J-like protein
MSTILYNQNALAARSRALGTLNGIDFGLVTLDSAPPPLFGVLELHFFNDQHLDELVIAANSPAAMWALVPVIGGDRIQAGPMSGQVQVTRLVHSAPQILQVTIMPVGDYSRYTLTILQAGFDPIFGDIVFRFRPGCFSSNCSPLVNHLPGVPQPTIDYMAKDYDSFRHTVISAMMQRVPSWQPTSEASLDLVLLDLFSAAADELSNYQDRVMQEAYWATAQNRITLRRQARLMDYFIHEGNQSSTVLALNFPGPASYTVPALQKAWTGPSLELPSTVWFAAAAPTFVDGIFSSVPLYTWSDAIPSLGAGATQADLAFSSFADATTATSLITSGKITRLLIEELLNPATGQAADRNLQKRQILNLTGAQLLTDPLTADPVVRVIWRPEDALTFTYCFVVFVNGVRVPNVALFHGNLVDVVQGKFTQFQYLPPGAPLTPGTYNFQLNAAGSAECRLPPAFPVLWTKTTPGGLQPSVSTVHVSVTDASGTTKWEEQTDLIHSDGVGDRHFVVETDELLRTLIRFGDGTNGVALPDDATVICWWLSGYGPDGNIGQDSLVNFDATGMPNIALGTVWNPFDVTDGLPPESANVIRRRVPEAYLYSQSRAITLADYIARAMEVPGVSNAAALNMWTGSWRTVRVVIDPVGTTTLSEALRAAVEQQLDAVHLIGEDVEVRAPEFAPLIIEVAVCISRENWIDDVSPVIEQAFCNSYTEDGEPAFFNPDRWTFGQALYASQIEGELAKIQGVEHVISIKMTRWWNQSITSKEVMPMAPEEIVLVENDPSRMERGSITFIYQGGRG